MPAAIVGREAELALVQDFVASVSDGAAALVLEADAGMGKTTLWRAGVAAAEQGGICVLQAVPAESEMALSFSGIGDLLDPVLGEALAPLPAGQKRALSRALVLDEDVSSPLDAHAVGMALLSAFRALAEQRPLLIAVDDVQWLDPASSTALVYAARRLRTEPVGVFLSRREPLESALPVELRRSFDAERFHAVDVGPLRQDALHHIVKDHLGLALSRPLLAEVQHASAGNPFYALEIVRTLQRTGVAVDAGHPLPVPESLHELVHGRLRALPAESLVFLTAAAAHAHPTIGVSEAASGVARDVALAPALEARVVELDDDRIRFTHPLLAAGAYEVSDPIGRRAIHGRLAELLEDPEARAWQLAASVERADEVVAGVLEEAAEHARMRGAPRSAALLLDRARRLTPPNRQDDAVRRAIAAASLHLEAGDSGRAEAQLRTEIDLLPPGPQRARALVVLARIRLYEAPHEADELFEQVLQEAGDHGTLALAHEGIAACSVWTFERFDRALRHSQVAMGLAAGIGDDALSADVLMAQLTAEAALGHETATATAERALALQGSTVALRILDQPLVAVAEYWGWVDLHVQARAALVDLLQRASDLGDENARPWLLVVLGDVERALGNLETALELARAGQEAAEQSRHPLFGAFGLALEGFVQAQRGRSDDARRAVHAALESSPDRFSGLLASAALGHLELSLQRPAEAAALLGPRVAFVQRENIVEPGACRFVVDQIEALVELGRREEAVKLVDWYEGNARRLGRASALASCARCRGMLASQAGEPEDALTAYEEALAWHAQVELPLDRGRTLFAFGAAQRRAKRRREARQTLEEALSVFERIGAELWAERARAELGRIGGRAATAGALTPAEERVAALVSEGKTNRQVAAALFLSERTVEGHLSRIYGKLGVRSRTELAHVLPSTAPQVVVESNTGDFPVSGTRSAP